MKGVKIVLYAVLCTCVVLCTAACVAPVNIGKLLEKESGGLVINLETPEDYAPALQWARSPYLSWVDVKGGETIRINFGDTIRVRAYALPGDFQSYSWHLDTASLAEFIPGIIVVDTNAAPFNIHPTAGYMISLIADKDSVPYSTYFYIVVN